MRADILLEKTELAWSQSRFEDFARGTERLLALFPAFGAGHQFKAALLLDAKDYEGARKEAELALSLNPDEEHRAFAHADLGYVGVVLGDSLETILGHLDEAIKTKSTATNSTLLVFRACMLERAGRRDEAQAEAAIILGRWSDDETVRKSLLACGLPHGITVVSKDARWDVLGNFIVSGVVRNDGDSSRQLVRVIAESLAPDGTVVGSGYSFVDPQYSFDPGMTGTFTIYVSGNPRNGTQFRVRLVDR